MTRLFVALGVVLCLSVPASAHAHNRMASYSTWDLRDDGATVWLKMPALALSALARSGTPAALSLLDPSAPLPPSVVEYLQTRLSLFSAGEPCEASMPVRLFATQGWLRFSWKVRCGGPPQTIKSTLLVAVPGHLHFVTARRQGESARDAVLSEPNPAFDLAAFHPSAWLYLPYGVRHVLSGWDHLTFVLLLVFVAVSGREVLALVTGFTIGHSITLGLSALGYVIPDLRAVEVLIALSIVAVAVENVWLDQERRSFWVPVVLAVGVVVLSALGSLPLYAVALFVLCYFGLLAKAPEPRLFRWGFAVLFGLVHGFGFAAVLNEGGTEVTVPDLFAFNLGVEAGQVAVVALAFPVLWWLKKSGFRRPLIVAGSTLGVAIGVYATLSRMLV